jgi:predicted lipid-binding transport protein (Tim44 family)
VAAGLDEIARAEPSFEAATFLEGAKAAYEMIVMSFAQGDRRMLKDLLRKDVYEVRQGTGEITVRFQSKLITATRDSSGAVVDGSPDAVVDVTDVWTFDRKLGSRDPNWRLIATEAGQ